MTKINDNIFCSGGKSGFIYIVSVEPVQVIQKIMLGIGPTSKVGFLYRSNDGFIIPNNYEKAVYSVFLIYKDFSTKKFFKFLKKPEENPILYNLLIKKNYNNGIFFPVCDDILTEYLMFFHPMTNEKYFIFVLKFILLFRESINLKMKSEEKYVFIEYTSLENANCIPNYCNDFFFLLFKPKLFWIL